MFLKLVKKISQFLSRIIFKSSKNILINSIYQKFKLQERSLVYGGFKLFVNSLICEASPGVLETIIVELDQNLKSKIGKNKLLNLGGGIGQIKDIYQSIGFDVYNLDIDTLFENERNIRFDLNNNQSLPYEKDYFDYVICSEVIEHLENPWKLFRDVKSILKKDGIFILSTPNTMSFYSRLMFLFKGYFKWFSPDCLSYHINPLFLWEIRMISQKINFQEIKILGSGDYFFKKNNNLKKIIKNNESLIFVFKKLNS